MAVILQMTYQKKLGLPNYSSHSCSVSLTVEIPDVSVAAQESTKLYGLLQTAVDNEIQAVGFMPDATTYGMNHRLGNGNGNGQTNDGEGNHAANRNGDRWNCTDGQKRLIIRLVNESNLNKQDVEDIEWLTCPFILRDPTRRVDVPPPARHGADMKLTAVFIPAAEGGFTALVEEIPGAISEGETIEEARENLADALRMVLECNRELARKDEPGGSRRETMELATL